MPTLLLLVALGYALILAFTTWAPTRVAEYTGLPHGVAVLLASILLAVDIPAAPAWGALSDWWGRRKPFLVGALAAVIAAMGVGCAMFLPASLAVLAQLLPADAAGDGFGAFLAAQVAGMAAGPLLLGPVFTHAGAPAALYAIAALSTAGVLLAARVTAR